MIVTRETVEDMLSGEAFKTYRKTALTRAVRIEGTFVCQTREGALTCKDGYLAVDKDGWPYPIERSVFEATYEAAG